MKFITPLLACSALSSSLAAEEFLDERFDYPDGALLSGGWFDTTSVQVIDGSVVHSGTGDGTGYANAAKKIIPLQDLGSNPVYVICWVEQLIDEPSNGFANITLARGGQLKLEAGTNFASGDTWNLKGLGDTTGDSGVDASQGSLARLVIRVEFGLFADSAAMWVNPGNLNNLGPADVSITDPGANYSFDRILIRSGNNSTNRILVDSIFVADTTVGAPNVDTPNNTSACCLSDGTCQSGDAQFCDAIGGQSQGDYSTCNFASCEPFGACCLDSETCEIQSPDTCDLLGGAYRGDGESCELTNCSPTGACCTPNGNCFQATASNCEVGGGAFQGFGAECADVACLVDLACCIGETCVPLDQAVCLASGGVFVGGECSASACAAPCPTDLDGNGETGFTDIVALLSAWGTPAGDVNGDGTTEFQDLIVLLSAFGDC